MQRWSKSGTISAMFTYLNPEIRRRLIEQEKLVRVNSDGQIIDVSSPEHPGELAVNVMGPIPMPMSLPGVEITVQWYAAVRSTELQGVESLASDLMARGGQHLFAHLVSPPGSEQRTCCWRTKRKSIGAGAQ